MQRKPVLADTAEDDVFYDAIELDAEVLTSQDAGLRAGRSATGSGNGRRDDGPESKVLHEERTAQSASQDTELNRF
jgi:hypothetical protein